MNQSAFSVIALDFPTELQAGLSISSLSLSLELNLKLFVLVLKTLHNYSFPPDSTESTLPRKHLLCCESPQPQLAPFD